MPVIIRFCMERKLGCMYAASYENIKVCIWKLVVLKTPDVMVVY